MYENDCARDENRKIDAAGTAAPSNLMHDAEDDRHGQKAIDLGERTENRTILPRQEHEGQRKNDAGDHAADSSVLNVLVGDHASEERTFGSEMAADVDGSEHGSDTAQKDPYGEQGQQKMRVCRLTEDGFPTQANDYGQQRIEKDVCTGGASKTPCEVEGYGCNDDEKEAAEREKWVRPLIELKCTEQGGKDDCIQQWDSFGIGDAHSTSVVHERRLERYWLS